jgi:hypothetical protein
VKSAAEQRREATPPRKGVAPVTVPERTRGSAEHRNRSGDRTPKSDPRDDRFDTLKPPGIEFAPS